MIKTRSVILVSWIGNADLRAANGEPRAGLGPIGQAVDTEDFGRIELLGNYDEAALKRYGGWLGERTKAKIYLHRYQLTSPINFREIYLAVVEVLERLRKEVGPLAAVTYHLSPGTPAMQSVWILLSKTTYPARLIQTSEEAGLQEADIPFDIAAEFIPDIRRATDRRVIEAAEGKSFPMAAFSDIIHRGPEMKRVISMAARAAVRSVPVLIEGESGTGKEMLAKAIHQASPRADKPCIAVNCGAIPAELVESEFFGHKKGAFSGAVESRVGHFEQANGGTLFLDEIGELPKPAQVKILRALQEGEIIPVGESKPRKVDVRVIAATNRSLTEEVAADRFREDLFFRLAVAVVKLPPLRSRKGDLGMLIDSLLDRVNLMASLENAGGHKKLSVGARKLMLGHPWPGNIRELFNTLLRATVWTDGDFITEDMMRAAIMEPTTTATRGSSILERELGGGFSLDKVIGGVARHYLERAMAQTRGNKSEAARLLGIGSYQTLSNWLQKYGVG